MTKFERMFEAWLDAHYQSRLEGLAGIGVDRVEHQQGYLAALRDVRKECGYISKKIMEG